MINNIAAKFEDITVIRQSIKPERPLTKMTEIIHPNRGIIIHRTLLKIANRIKIKNINTPTPNFFMSSAIKSVISDVIIGTPPKKIEASSL